jgi:hypothetical protein
MLALGFPRVSPFKYPWGYTSSSLSSLCIVVGNEVQQRFERANPWGKNWRMTLCFFAPRVRTFDVLHTPQEYCKTTKIKRPFRGVSLRCLN